MHRKVWEASGHVAGFTDPLVDCKVSKQRYRADQLFYSLVVVDGRTIGCVSALESERTAEELQEKAETLKRKQAVQGKLEPVRPRDLTEATPEEIALVPSPATGEPGSLTGPRAFNLMFENHVGALRDESAATYLRPETAQGMFVDFKRRRRHRAGPAAFWDRPDRPLLPQRDHPQQLHLSLPRAPSRWKWNYFIHEDDDWTRRHREWIDWCKNWLLSIGLPQSHLSEFNHPKEKLAFYSKGTTDIMFRYPFGVQELWGIAARGNLRPFATRQRLGRAPDDLRRSEQEEIHTPCD